MSSYAVLYQSSILNRHEPDDFYSDEFNLMKDTCDVGLLDLNELHNNKIKVLGSKNISDAYFLYRGWMLTGDDYKRLNELLGNRLIINGEEYLKSHWIKNWYDEIKGLTFETVFATESNVVETFKNTGWSSVFVKDYVKSLSTQDGAIATDESSLLRIISDMKKYRGFIEGGLALRKVEDILPETEQRFFVFNQQIISVDYNSYLDVSVSILLQEVIDNHHAQFFTVDIVQLSNGDWRVVEIGDAQVSDLKKNGLESFVNGVNGALERRFNPSTPNHFKT